MANRQSHLSGSVFLACILTLALGGSACDRGTSMAPTGASGSAAKPVLREAPDFLLANSEGKPLSLKDLRGSPVIVHFWATWCPPCMEEIGEWLSAATAIGSKQGLKWVAISLDSQWTDAFKVLPTRRVPNGVVSLIDPQMKSSQAFGSFQFPETYLVNAAGRIVTKWVGPQGWSDQTFREAIFKKLAE